MKIQFRSRASFSLIELIFVLLVASALIFMAVEGLGGMAQGAAITTSAAMLDDALSDGRTLAMAENTPVEVRIYDLPPAPGAAPVYNALQLHWLKADGTTPPAASPVLLSTWVAIDATATHSTLIAVNNQVARPDAADSRLNTQTRVFHFMPDGSTDLNPAANWFMTLRAATQSDPARFPADWASVRVDAATGKVTVFRP